MQNKLIKRYRLNSRIIQVFQDRSDHWFCVLCENGSLWRFSIISKQFELISRGGQV